MARFDELGGVLGISFKNEALIKEALTHRSYLNENPDWNTSHNERLEYLGDAVLELVVTEHLFKKYPDRHEGQLTSFRAALVNYQMLATIARDIELEKYLFLSKGESQDTRKARDVILANAIEAVLGAIYLDQGYEVAQRVITTLVLSRVEKIVEEGLYRDPKSELQERVQEMFRVTPSYRVLHEEGPDHEKSFSVGVYFGEKLTAKGVGTSKQEAESRAAVLALEYMRKGSDASKEEQ